MNLEKAIQSLTRNGFAVSHFATGEAAADYLAAKITGETVGFGGSKTIEAMGLYEKLQPQNTVLWHWKDPDALSHYSEFTTYITSANAVSETGELVNIDGNGNRLAGSSFGPKKLYYVVGSNKLAPDLPAAIDRARNVAAPLNAARLARNTPCKLTGKCADCHSPERICRAILIQLCPMAAALHTEVVLIDEPLGF